MLLNPDETENPIVFYRSARSPRIHSSTPFPTQYFACSDFFNISNNGSKIKILLNVRVSRFHMFGTFVFQALYPTKSVFLICFGKC